MRTFLPTNLLIPREPLLPAWAVIACDQFTSQPEYWAEVRSLTAGRPSALNLILPEAELGSCDVPGRVREIRAAMDACLTGDVFRELPESLVYLERTLADGSIRRGVVGTVDLEAYDPSPRSTARDRKRSCRERV